MISLRRKLLNHELNRVAPQIQGDVLDVGGKRNHIKGNYIPPASQAKSWKYLNPDPKAQPDYLGTLQNVRLPSESFDFVYLIEVLEYLKNPIEDLTAIQGVLRKGGKLFLSMPLFFPIHGDREEDRLRWTSVTLKSVLSEAGFDQIEIISLGSLFAVIYDFLYAAFSYSAPIYPGGFFRKVAWRLLGFTQPVFEFLDAFFDNRKPFMTTGYFVTCTKA